MNHKMNKSHFFSDSCLISSVVHQIIFALNSDWFMIFRVHDTLFFICKISVVMTGHRITGKDKIKHSFSLSWRNSESNVSPKGQLLHSQYINETLFPGLLPFQLQGKNYTVFWLLNILLLKLFLLYYESVLEGKNKILDWIFQHLFLILKSSWVDKWLKLETVAWE